MNYPLRVMGVTESEWEEKTERGTVQNRYIYIVCNDAKTKILEVYYGDKKLPFPEVEEEPEESGGDTPPKK